MSMYEYYYGDKCPACTDEESNFNIDSVVLIDKNSRLGIDNILYYDATYGIDNINNVKLYYKISFTCNKADKFKTKCTNCEIISIDTSWAFSNDLQVVIPDRLYFPGANPGTFKDCSGYENAAISEGYYAWTSFGKSYSSSAGVSNNTSGIIALRIKANTSIEIGTAIRFNDLRVLYWDCGTPVSDRYSLTIGTTTLPTTWMQYGYCSLAGDDVKQLIVIPGSDAYFALGTNFGSFIDENENNVSKKVIIDWSSVQQPKLINSSISETSDGSIYAICMQRAPELYTLDEFHHLSYSGYHGLSIYPSSPISTDPKLPIIYITSLTDYLRDDFDNNDTNPIYGRLNKTIQLDGTTTETSLLSFIEQNIKDNYIEELLGYFYNPSGDSTVDNIKIFAKSTTEESNYRHITEFNSLIFTNGTDVTTTTGDTIINTTLGRGALTGWAFLKNCQIHYDAKVNEYVFDKCYGLENLYYAGTYFAARLSDCSQLRNIIFSKRLIGIWSDWAPTNSNTAGSCLIGPSFILSLISNINNTTLAHFADINLFLNNNEYYDARFAVSASSKGINNYFKFSTTDKANISWQRLALILDSSIDASDSDFKYYVKEAACQNITTLDSIYFLADLYTDISYLNSDDYVYCDYDYNSPPYGTLNYPENVNTFDNLPSLEIKDNAFDGCSNLNYINIPGKVTTIGASAFKGCTKLTCVDVQYLDTWVNITFGDEYANPLINTNAIRDYRKYYIFDDPSYGYIFTTQSDLVVLDLTNGLFNRDYETIPINSLPYGTFKGNVNINKLIIDTTSLDYLKSNVFEGCFNLLEISIKSDNTLDSTFDFNDYFSNYFAGCPKLYSLCTDDSTIINQLKENNSTTIRAIQDTVDATNLYNGTWGDLPVFVCIDNNTKYVLGRNNRANYLGPAHRSTAALVTLTNTLCIGEQKYTDFKIAPYALYRARIDRNMLINFSNTNGITYDFPKYALANTHNSNIYNLYINLDSITTVDALTFGDIAKELNVTVNSSDSFTWEDTYIPVIHNYNSSTSLNVPDGVTQYTLSDGMSILRNNCEWYFKSADAQSYTLKAIYKVNTDIITVDTHTNVPDNLNNLPVLTIAESVADSNLHIKTLTLGRNLREIGKKAFAGCSNLAVINYNSSNLTDCTDESLIFTGVGTNVKAGTTVNIGSSVQRVPKYIFYPGQGKDNKHKISKVIFKADSMCTEIGSYAFNDCVNLTTITDVPNSLEAIQTFAFEGCSSLEAIYLPVSLKTLGLSAFANCYNLSLIEYNAENLETQSYYVFRSAGRDSKIKLDIYTSKLPANLFASAYFNEINFNCDSSEIIEIGQSCFEYAILPETLYVPKSLVSYGINAFRGISGLNRVCFEGVISEWVNITFKNGAANPLNIGADLCTKGGSWYVDYYFLDNKITKELKPYVFCGCTSLKYVNLVSADYPGAIDEETTIYGECLRGCRALETLMLDPYDSRLTFIYNNTSNTSLVHISELFGDSPANDEFDYKITYNKAYNGCIPKSLKNVILKCNIIEDYLLEGVKLDKLLIDGPTYKPLTISINAFSDKSDVKSIYFGGSIEDLCKAEIRTDWEFFHNLYVDSDYTYGDGSEIQIKEGTLVTSVDTSEFKTDVINSYVFNKCTSLQQVKITDNITKINKNAFSNCEQLKTINIINTNNNLELASSVFYYNNKEIERNTTIHYFDSTKLNFKNAFRPEYYKNSNITIQAGVLGTTDFSTTICNNLVLGADVTAEIGAFTQNGTIGEDLSSQYGPLESRAQITTISVDASNSTLFLDHNNNVLYIKDEPSTFKCVYANNTTAGKIVLPKGTTFIASGAFMDCMNITDLECPHTVKEIGAQAFKNCSELQHLSLPYTLTNLAIQGLLIGCNKLESLIIPKIELTSLAGDLSQWWGTGTDVPDTLNSLSIFASVIPDRYFCNCDSLTYCYLDLSVLTVGASILAGCKFDRNSNLKDAKPIKVGSRQPEDLPQTWNTNWYRQCVESGDALDYIEWNVLFPYISNNFVYNVITYNNTSAIQLVGLEDVDQLDETHELKLPAQIEHLGLEKLPVVKIKADAFSDNFKDVAGVSPDTGKNIQTLQISTDYLEFIGERAFKNCSDLTHIYFIGDTVDFSDPETQITEIEIEKDAFEQCTGIEEVYCEHAWSYLTFNDKYSNPMAAAEPGKVDLYLIDDLTGELKLVTFYIDFLKQFEHFGDTIPKFAFINCNSLTAVGLDDTPVIKLAESAFSNCLNLITFSGNNIQIIEKDALGGCLKLTTLSLAKLNDDSDSTLCADSELSVVEITISGLNRLANVNTISSLCLHNNDIPKNIEDKFTSDSRLLFLVIPVESGIAADQISALAECKNITTIAVPTLEHVNQLDKMSLVEITIDPQQEIDIPDAYFKGFTNLESLTCKVAKIGNSAFEGCSALKSLTFNQQTLQYVGEDAFKDINPDLLVSTDFFTYIKTNSANNPEIIYKIKNLENLEPVDLSTARIIYQNAAIDNDNITTIQFTNAFNLQQICDYAFKNCANLIKFEYNSNIDDLAQKGLNIIGKEAFAGCTSLESGIRIMPEASVHNTSFSKCVSIETVEISQTDDNVKYIGLPNIRGKLCVLLSALPLEDYAGDLFIPDTVISVQSGALLGIQIKRLTLTETDIAAKLFEGQENLHTIVIKSSVKSIGEDAFKDCNRIKSITYDGSYRDWCLIDFKNQYANPLFITPNYYKTFEVAEKINSNGAEINLCGVKHIPDCTFYRNSKCLGIVVDEELETIGEYAFYQAGPRGTVSGLTEINLSTCTKLKMIKKNAFAHCSACTTVLLPEVDNLTLGDYAFYNTPISKLVIDQIDNIRLGHYVFGPMPSLKTLVTNTSLLAQLASPTIVNLTIRDDNSILPLSSFSTLKNLEKLVLIDPAAKATCNLINNNIGKMLANCKKLFKLTGEGFENNTNYLIGTESDGLNSVIDLNTNTLVFAVSGEEKNNDEAIVDLSAFPNLTSIGAYALSIPAAQGCKFILPKNIVYINRDACKLVD